MKLCPECKGRGSYPESDADCPVCLGVTEVDDLYEVRIAMAALHNRAVALRQQSDDLRARIAELDAELDDAQRRLRLAKAEMAELEESA